MDKTMDDKLVNICDYMEQIGHSVQFGKRINI